MLHLNFNFLVLKNLIPNSIYNGTLKNGIAQNNYFKYEVR